MPNREFLFTSESVTEGHPDKVADQISDAMLDALLAIDPEARVACETMVGEQRVVLMGEIRSDARVDRKAIVRDVIARIGYTEPELGFDSERVEISDHLGLQSPDIAQGVDRSCEARAGDGGATRELLAGAGDQGMMFGYATRDTRELMPMPIALAHRFAARLADVRKKGKAEWLRPDGKTQVTVRYRDGKPVGIERVLVSTQHTADIDQDMIRDAVWEHVVKPCLPENLDTSALPDALLVNPTGRFVIGGPVGDAGLTGRKIIVDTYGGMARHGGGAFSGKDPSKVDRSAAYATRYVAKNVVAAGLADRCEVQVAYAIGVAHPVSVMIETFGTEKVGRAQIDALVREHFDLRPGAFREYLKLHRPIFQKTAAYGHFGREDHDFTWERTDKAEALRAAAGLGERDASLFEAYRRTIIEVEDGQRHRIRPGSPPPEPLARFGVFHVITAWNPAGVRQSRAENDVAQLALQTEVESRGTRVASARGHDPDGSWEAEESVAIWGLSRSEAIELGQRHGQNAIFEVSDEGPKVLDCTPGPEGARRA